MSLPDLIKATEPVVDTLNRLGVSYYIGGSVASSAMGIARMTLDVDLISSLTLDKVDAFVTALAKDFYIDKETIQDAIKLRRSFNLVHLETAFKVDIFITKQRDIDKLMMQRAKPIPIDDNHPNIIFNIASAEDILLAKLEWYRSGKEISDKQWHDILGILRVQAADLDLNYLEKWANFIGVYDLLIKAKNMIVTTTSD